MKKRDVARDAEAVKRKIAYIVLILSLAAVMVLGILYGSVSIPLQETLRVLWGADTTSKIAVIIRSVRLPRVLAGMAAGAGLGTAGVVLQVVMNNSLASPNTIGVNSGAGFLVMLSMILFPQNFLMRSTMAFAGALITSVLILSLAYTAGKSRISIILAGITVSSILSAGMNMMKILDSDANLNMTHFLVGSLSGVTMKDLRYPLAGILVGIVALFILSNALNILELGDGIASSLGLRVNLFRMIFVILASFLAGLVVSFSGLIGFVGLIVPHICRHFFGQDARALIPAASLTGAIFVVGADLLGRVIFAPYEIPVGILLSLTGGPFFLYLLLRKGGRRVNA